MTERNLSLGFSFMTLWSTQMFWSSSRDSSSVVSSVIWFALGISCESTSTRLHPYFLKAHSGMILRKDVTSANSLSTSHYEESNRGSTESRSEEKGILDSRRALLGYRHPTLSSHHLHKKVDHLPTKPAKTRTGAAQWIGLQGLPARAETCQTFRFSGWSMVLGKTPGTILFFCTYWPIWDAKDPWNDSPQNAIASLGERFCFSSLFAMSKTIRKPLHGFNGAPTRKNWVPKSQKNLLNH